MGEPIQIIFNHEPDSLITRCTIWFKDETRFDKIVKGISRCSDLDIFNEGVGQRVALKKALASYVGFDTDSGYLNKQERSAAWIFYFQSWPIQRESAILQRSKVIDGVNGKYFSYKGNTYYALADIKMKHPVNHKWVEAVMYIPVDKMGETNDEKYYVRSLKDFLTKFKSEDDTNSRSDSSQ